ncbi:MAG TPA: 16S rRNA (cytidine(1402)-2'-O)-methyltransferase [Stellaceae bacterium]|nr:16S rRNA (cytidine(1402)-2'-O)-methyltransferase [Stellaceae bacterium]
MPRRTGPQRGESARFEAGGRRTTRADSGRSGDEGREPIGGIAGSKSEAPGEREQLAAGLYVVATPIGNLGDITLRALEVLRRADLIACEDTRVTATLAARFGLRAERVAYHDHNADAVRPRLLERMAAGGSVALVSDAGTPLVSDPGFKLVRAAREAGIAVTALPGASAALAALMVAGLPTDRFLFAGFLPAKPGQRQKALTELAAVRATLVLFETAPRLAATLADMAAALGPRDAAVARELTKLYEEVRRGTLAELAAHYAAAGPPRGEIVLVVGPPAAAPALVAEEVDERLATALETMSVADASSALAAETGLPRRELYARALALRGKSGA